MRRRRGLLSLVLSVGLALVAIDSASTAAAGLGAIRFAIDETGAARGGSAW